ncbi:MAG: RtcB family protein [Patescibacteria group bacterium]|nr:RtcB family protein [Patescibacteria group bacterium]MCL5262028.1 RtcB family protein [Patescibacteria group bacterium]
MERSALRRINDWLWEIPKTYRSDMRVPARVYATEEMLDEIIGDRSLDQLVNVAGLPGIVDYAIAMPDIHEGYGFPVGGVAAFDLKEGIISPGGIGYDINCGVRLLRSNIDVSAIRSVIPELGRALYREIPSGVGQAGRLKLTDTELDEVLRRGAGRMTEIGYGDPADLKNCEEQGCLAGADPRMVSVRAKDRGRDQLGTIGAGNHFVEVETIEEIFDKDAADKFGLFPGQVVILIHTGSRGLGHQVATDYIREMMRAMPRHGIFLKDRELACVPFDSDEGRNYFQAMAGAANFAWGNRELISWEVRRAWRGILGDGAGELELLYDVAHNIAKIEEYAVSGANKKLVIHRKGATRSFPGQPVLVPGSMGTRSYLLMGESAAMKESFGSSCHGAGRRMSRTEARRKIRGGELKQKLSAEGVSINAGSISGLAEEAPEAYKDVDQVVDVISRSGIAAKIARMKPVAVIKG